MGLREWETTVEAIRAIRGVFVQTERWGGDWRCCLMLRETDFICVLDGVGARGLLRVRDASIAMHAGSEKKKERR